MEGGWDRLCNHAGALEEHDGNDKPLAESNINDDDNYDRNGDIPDNNNKYTIGVDGVDKPLDKGVSEYDTLSAAPARACPKSQWPSVPSH